LLFYPDSHLVQEPFDWFCQTAPQDQDQKSFHFTIWSCHYDIDHSGDPLYNIPVFLKDESMEEFLQTLQFVPPYKILNGRRRTTLRQYWYLKGVYFICENGMVIYIGMSQSCVYKALYRHFESWDDPRIKRQTYTDDPFRYQVAIIPSDDATQLEKEMIRLFKPRDNREFYEQDIPVPVIEEVDIPF